MNIIAALATPLGTGGVAIIRVSGDSSWHFVQSLTSSQDKQWVSHHANYTWLVDPHDGTRLDEVLILPFKGPNSFTGEDCVEIHCHGGYYLAHRVVQLCLEAGAHPAEPGEFTRRAVLNGRLDLTQAESILDLIHAQGEAMVKLAAHNLYNKALSRTLQTYAQKISHIQADLTASIDFPDEVDEPDRQALAMQLNTLKQAIGNNVAQSQSRQVIRNGIEVALIGAPNAGKSSLFNALLAMDRAIVTEIAGTTRDVLREPLNINGLPFMLLDTAGLRESDDRVEQLGVLRTREAVSGCDAVIYVMDGTQSASAQQERFHNLRLIQQPAQPLLILYNKKDMQTFKPILLTDPDMASVTESVSVSAETGEGLHTVREWLSRLAPQNTLEMGYLLSFRQMQTLESVAENCCDSANVLDNPNLPIDLATVALTDALQQLQGLLGYDTTEAMLDSVFSRFCVGK